VLKYCLARLSWWPGRIIPECMRVEYIISQIKERECANVLGIPDLGYLQFIHLTFISALTWLVSHEFPFD
jgi:hypothetical protein